MRNRRTAPSPDAHPISWTPAPVGQRFGLSVGVDVTDEIQAVPQHVRLTLRGRHYAFGAARSRQRKTVRRLRRRRRCRSLCRPLPWSAQHIPATFYARNGEPNQLYRNNGEGTCSNVTERAGVMGFAGMQWAIGSHIKPVSSGDARFLDDLYMSGTTFFTLGLGDVQPVGRAARVLTVAEAGTGFGFLALVIAYFPVLYQSFSRREVRLTLLDAWAGSPPSAAEVLRRLASQNQLNALDPFLRDWEYWCSEVLESHISYPTVAFFRSQHQRQSWVSALAAILDPSALISVAIDGLPTWQAHATFAIARHTAVDLAQVPHARPDPTPDRLLPSELELLRRQLESVGLKLERSAAADRQLSEMRRSYEPYILGLAETLLMSAAHWWRPVPRKDNWQTSPKSAAPL